MSNKFPIKLMSILDSHEHHDIISWLPHGRGFIIRDKKRLADLVLPKYFKESKYTSFTRRLNRWNFTIQTHGHKEASYFHPMFTRGDPQRVLEMHPVPQSSFKSKRRESRYIDDRQRVDLGMVDYNTSAGGGIEHAMNAAAMKMNNASSSMMMAMMRGPNNNAHATMNEYHDDPSSNMPRSISGVDSHPNSFNAKRPLMPPSAHSYMQMHSSSSNNINDNNNSSTDATSMSMNHQMHSPMHAFSSNANHQSLPPNLYANAPMMQHPGNQNFAPGNMMRPNFEVNATYFQTSSTAHPNLPNGAMVQQGQPNGPMMMQGQPNGPMMMQGGPMMMQGGPIMMQGGHPNGPMTMQGGHPNGPMMMHGHPNGPMMAQGGHPNGPMMMQGRHPNGPMMIQGGHPNGPMMIQGQPNGPMMAQGGHPNGPMMMQGGHPNGPMMIQGMQGQANGHMMANETQFRYSATNTNNDRMMQNHPLLMMNQNEMGIQSNNQLGDYRPNQPFMSQSPPYHQFPGNNEALKGQTNSQYINNVNGMSMSSSYPTSSANNCGIPSEKGSTSENRTKGRKGAKLKTKRSSIKSTINEGYSKSIIQTETTESTIIGSWTNQHSKEDSSLTKVDVQPEESNDNEKHSSPSPDSLEGEDKVSPMKMSRKLDVKCSSTEPLTKRVKETS